MRRLLVGPAGAGTSRTVASEVRARLERGDARFGVLVPTATMAHRMRQDLAARGFILHSGTVRTIADFVESLAPAVAQPSPAAHQYLVRQALETLNPPEFRALASSPGLIATLARAQEELYNAGCDALRLEALTGMGVLRGGAWNSFAAVCAEVEKQMLRRGFALRAARVSSVAAAIRHAAPLEFPASYWDGFFSLTLAERELVKALPAGADVTITLPEWPGAAATMTRLASAGFEIVRDDRVPSVPAEELVEGASVDDEVEEIALRMREAHRGGRSWKDMLLIVRAALPYLPLLKTTLARFGIPARAHFTSQLSHWGEALGPALSAKLPSEDDVQAWQRRAALESAVLEALEDARRWMDPAPDSIAALAIRAPEFLRNTPVRIRDSREDAVSIVDVFEARQWRVPEVFVCGFIEGQFPRRPPLEALLTAEARRRIAEQGIPVDTDMDRARREDFLFEVARTRAAERLTLSWHRFDAKGEPVARSRWLDHLPQRPAQARAVRLNPWSVPPRAQPPALLGDLARGQLRKTHARIRATALESFLQCPFQFYGRSTLGLEPSAAEEDPLDARELGTLIHKVVAAWYQRRNAFIEFLFEDEWAKFVTADQIPAGYRAELARATLLRSLSHLAAEPRIEAGWAIKVEHAVELLWEGVRISGRIDRFDVGPERRARAFDFKYSAKAGIEKRFRKTEEGLSVQGGIYLIGLREQGYRPEAFEFAALRGEIAWKGWSGTEVSELMAQAEAVTRAAIPKILAGEIRPDPADRDLCRFCEFRDACRVQGGMPQGSTAASAAGGIAESARVETS